MTRLDAAISAFANGLLSVAELRAVAQTDGSPFAHEVLHLLRQEPVSVVRLREDARSLLAAVPPSPGQDQGDSSVSAA